MREEAGKWKAYDYESGQLHQCGNTKAADVTASPPETVTQQSRLADTVIIGGMTPEVEQWLKNLMKQVIKEELSE